MDLLNQHVEHYLESFISEKEFDNFIFDNIDNYPKKKRYLKLLKYIDKLIEFRSDYIINNTHIHFENDFDQDLENVIFQLIIAKCFKHHRSYEEKNCGQNEDNCDLKHKINEIQKKLYNLECCCPEGASARKGGNRLYKNWVLQKRELNCLFSFYNRLKANTTFSYKTLINCKVGLKNQVLGSYLLNPLATDIQNSDFKFYYNIINTDYTLNDIDKKWDFLDSTINVIMFDCESKRLMLNFSFEELNKWNTEYGTNFKNYFVITFGNGTNSINKTKDKIDTVKERFKIKDGNSYTILMSELNIILKRKTNKINIELVGLESLIFWDTFIIETSIRELYELRSIKLMNIYSICYTDDIKAYIIEDLFSKKESSELISSSTKMAILELRDDDINIVKESLSQTLDFIIKSDIKSKILECLLNTPTIIIDESILRNGKLLSKVTSCFGLSRDLKFKSWSDLLNFDSNYFLILSYRDQGKYPNYYYPNLLEVELDSEKTLRAILPSFLFGPYYSWSKYYLLKEYHKLLTHPIRESHFEWSKLKNKLKELKPIQKLNIDWNLENEYSNTEQRDTYKIKLKGQKVKTAYESDLFIISNDKNTHLKVVKTDFLLSHEKDDSKIYVQYLNEIQENINIYEKIVNQQQQEEELDVIRKQFNLSDETAGRLWKVLLKNLADKIGEDELYSELKNYFETKGLKIVSQFHFKNSWINPQSISIAPLSKRVFIELCEYLKIPRIYYVIIQRIRNASKQSSRQSTRQMNQLLKDLFNDCCFDNNKIASEIINNRLEHYKANHPLDELGIDEIFLVDNLVTLVELIQPELNLVELETIEKVTNE